MRVDDRFPTERDLVLMEQSRARIDDVTVETRATLELDVP